MKTFIGITWIVSLFFGTFASAKDGFVFDLFVLRQPLAEVMSKVDVAQSMGATHFNIPVVLCQKERRSDSVTWCSDQHQAFQVLATAMKARGLSIGIFPFLLSEDDAWRGEFEPQNFKWWSESYYAHLLELANWANAVGATDFIVGSELSRLYISKDAKAQKERTHFWRSTLNSLREKIPGASVFVVANWDQFEIIPFWDASDYIGLSAYYPLTHAEGAATSVDALVQGWAPWARRLRALSDRAQRPLYFSEVGYSSMQSAAFEPWRFDPPAPLDLDLQARLYEAFGQVWGGDSHLARFMLWALEIVENPLQDIGFTPIGKPAQKVLSRVYHSR